MNFSDIKIDKVCSAFEVQRIKEDVRKQPNRKNSAIVIIKNGKISYYQDDVEYIQTADTAIILPEGTTYSLYCHEDAECYIINFEEYSSCIGNNIQAVRPVNMNNVIDMADKMCRAWDTRTYSYNLKAISYLYSIMAEVNGAFSMDKKNVKYYEIIKPSIKYMEEHYYDHDIKNDELAKLSNISTVYFRKIFTKIYGVPPMHYIEIRRLEKAKELLATDELSVTEIASLTGFKDIYQLSRFFKKMTGLSPNKYRNLTLM